MTELQTIEVRYEDQSGRHVDVHEAAKEGRHGDGTFIVSNGLCACCEATENITSYNEDNVVKVEYGPSDHSNPNDVERKGTAWVMVGMVLLFGAIVAALELSGGTITL